MVIRDRGLYGFFWVLDKSINVRSPEGALRKFFFVFWGDELFEIFIQTDDSSNKNKLFVIRQTFYRTYS